MLLFMLQILFICISFLTWICISSYGGIALCHHRSPTISCRKNLLILPTLWMISSFMVYVALLCLQMSPATCCFLIACNVLLVLYAASLMRRHFFRHLLLRVQRCYADVSDFASCRWQASVSKRSRTFIPTAEQKQRIYNYLHSPELFRKKVTLTGMSRCVAIDRANLSRFIRQEFGVTLAELITSLRLNHAERLLSAPDKEDRTITEISEMCGFQALSSFYQAFRERHPVSPLEWKEQNHTKNRLSL